VDDWLVGWLVSYLTLKLVTVVILCHFSQKVMSEDLLKLILKYIPLLLCCIEPSEHSGYLNIKNL